MIPTLLDAIFRTALLVVGVCAVGTCIVLFREGLGALALDGEES